METVSAQPLDRATGFFTAEWDREVDSVMAEAVETFSTPNVSERAFSVGSSDIGRCMYQVVEGKRNPRPRTASTLAHFLRGHTREEFTTRVHGRLCEKWGVVCSSQVFVQHPNNKDFRANIDRVFHVGEELWESSRLRVVEEKHPDYLPPEVRDYWYDQTLWQIGILSLNAPWAKVDGLLWANTLRGPQRSYGVWEYSPDHFEKLLRRADQMLSHLRKGTEATPEPGLPCGKCEYVLDCPAWQSKEIPESKELLELLARYREAGVVKKAAEDDREGLKTALVEAMFPQMKYPSGPPERYRGILGKMPVEFQVQKGRLIVDAKLLELEYPEIFEKVSKRSKPPQVLKVLGGEED